MRPPKIRQIGDNWYAYFYDVSRQPKRKSVPLGQVTQRKAEAAANRYYRDWIAGRYDPWKPRRAEVSPVLTAMLKAFLEERSHLRPKSHETTAVNGLEAAVGLDVPIAAVTADMVRAYIDAAGVSEATRLHRYRHLKAFFQWAKEAEYTPENPIDAVRRPKVGRKEAPFLSVDEFGVLLAQIDKDAEARTGKNRKSRNPYWLRHAVELAVYTGLRREELCMLRWQDVDLAKGFLTVRCRGDFQTKSGHDRPVPIVKDSRALLEKLHARWRSEQATDGARILPMEAYVLRGEKGGKLDASFLSHQFKKAIVDAELSGELHFHSLRHTCASWLAMRGVDMYTIAKILGHSSGVQTTQRYAHLSPNAIKAAMEQAFGG